jgi:hypothetical protein
MSLNRRWLLLTPHIFVVRVPVNAIEKKSSACFSVAQHHESYSRSAAFTTKQPPSNLGGCSQISCRSS